MAVNCYIVIDSDTRKALIIDPGDEANYLAGEIEKQKAHPVAVVATHGHFDHILAALELQLIYKIPFRMDEADKFLLDRMRTSAEQFLGRKVVELPPQVTAGLRDGDVIAFGNSALAVIPTPGHTPGSVSLYAKGCGLFAGDTIFAAGAVGRTDFAYSDTEKLLKSLRLILSLPEDTKMYCGHGDDTSVAAEKPYHKSDVFSR